MMGRYLNDEKVLCIFNFSRDPQWIRTDADEDFTDMWTKESARADDFGIEPYGFKWLHIGYGKKANKQKAKRGGR